MTIISGFDLLAGQQRVELPLSSAREHCARRQVARASFDGVKYPQNGRSGVILPPLTLSGET